MIERGIWYVHLFLRLFGHSCFQPPLNIQGIPNLVKLWQQTQMFPGEKKRHLLEVPPFPAQMCMSPPCNLLSLKPINYFFAFFQLPYSPWKWAARFGDQIAFQSIGPLASVEKNRNLGGFVTGIAHLFAAGRHRTWKYDLIVFLGLSCRKVCLCSDLVPRINLPRNFSATAIFRVQKKTTKPKPQDPLHIEYCCCTVYYIVFKHARPMLGVAQAQINGIGKGKQARKRKKESTETKKR